jgi:2'-5' RNA ligase
VNLSHLKKLFGLVSFLLLIALWGCAHDPQEVIPKSDEVQTKTPPSGQNPNLDPNRNPDLDPNRNSESAPYRHPEPAPQDPTGHNSPTAHPVILDKLVVMLVITDPSSINFLNQSVAIPAGLQSYFNYHVTLGFVENVPRHLANEIKAQLQNHLDTIHNPSTNPIPFEIKDATTFRLLGSQNYRSRSVILIPKDDRPFKNLNQALDAHLKSYAGLNLKLDPPTSLARYIPHITLSTPYWNLTSGISQIRAALPTYSNVMYLDRYEIH